MTARTAYAVGFLDPRLEPLLLNTSAGFAQIEGAGSTAALLYQTAPQEVVVVFQASRY